MLLQQKKKAGRCDSLQICKSFEHAGIVIDTEGTMIDNCIKNDVITLANTPKITTMYFVPMKEEINANV